MKYAINIVKDGDQSIQLVANLLKIILELSKCF